MGLFQNLPKFLKAPAIVKSIKKRNITDDIDTSIAPNVTDNTNSSETPYASPTQGCQSKISYFFNYFIFMNLYS